MGVKNSFLFLVSKKVYSLDYYYLCMENKK